MEHASNPYLEFRKKFLRPIEKRESRFNDFLAVTITNIVGTMWCAYAFACLALISLPAAIKAGTPALIDWIAQTFLQLVLLSIIMVGQKVVAAKSDRRLEQTYKDAEALLKMSDEIHCPHSSSTTPRHLCTSARAGRSDLAATTFWPTMMIESGAELQEGLSDPVDERRACRHLIAAGRLIRARASECVGAPHGADDVGDGDGQEVIETAFALLDGPQIKNTKFEVRFRSVFHGIPLVTA